jgi:putative MFS transporter
MQSASVVRNAAVWVAALGYFVDIYDLLLFSIVRIPSLDDLGVANSFGRSFRSVIALCPL